MSEDGDAKYNSAERSVMTSKTIATARTDRELERFLEFPPRDDMRNWNFVLAGIRRFQVLFDYGRPENPIPVIRLQVSLDIVEDSILDIRG